MKKVLLVATVQSHICQFHRPLVELLHKHDCIVHVAARDNLKEKNGLKLDFADEVFDIPFCRSPFELKNITAYKKLKKVIDEGGYDVIHCNTPVGGVLTRLAAKKVRKNGTEVYYTAHGFHFYKGAPLVNWFLYYPVEKMLARKTDKLITIVEEDYQLAKRKFKCPVYRIHGVGVDEKRFYPLNYEEKINLRKKLGFIENQKIILCVGELLANKNQQMIIKCMPQILEKIPEAILLIAGNGPKRDELESLIDSLNLQKKVIMLGYATNIQEYHQISDILVSCSIREGLPVNVIESMMSGNPVVLTDNRGHRELIDEGRCGYLVKINDIDHTSENIKNILLSKDKYETFSKNTKLFSHVYSSGVVKKEIGNLYEI